MLKIEPCDTLQNLQVLIFLIQTSKKQDFKKPQWVRVAEFWLKMGITNIGQSLHSLDKHSKFVSLFLFTEPLKFGRRYQEDNLYYDVFNISSFGSAWKWSKISFLVIFWHFFLFPFLKYLYFGIPFSLA